MSNNGKKSIALLGGGPAALFMFKRIVEAARNDYDVYIFEKNAVLGKGMPYSKDGANEEHITNVSDTEIPELVNSIEDWLDKAPDHLKHQFKITPENFNELKVLPRLLFGEYLAAQFHYLLQMAKTKGIKTTVYYKTKVIDVRDQPETGKVFVYTEKGEQVFDQVVICTGHSWPTVHEGKVPGYYDSPYPPEKLSQSLNFPVAIRGSSLTAFDAIRTLSRKNGHFFKKENDMLGYELNKESFGFKIVMHSLNGLLPAIRIHLEDSQLSKGLILTSEQLNVQRELNDGFVSLDFLFEEKFKNLLLEKDNAFYERIKEMTLEDFVGEIMKQREQYDPFTLFEAEYKEAEKSIRDLEPVHWKEMLAELSFIVNYPAKYFSAEDILRLNKVLMPLISIVIAFVPQGSAQEIIALHNAGVLSIVDVDKNSRVEVREEEGILYRYTDVNGNEKMVTYKFFVDSIGQSPFVIQDIPLKGLVENHTVTEAKLLFRFEEEAVKLKNEGNKDVEQDRNGSWYLKVPGIMINDNFQVVDSYGAYNDRIYLMAVPYIGGINPDYSGLDFCEAASAKIIKALPLPTETETVNEIN